MGAGGTANCGGLDDRHFAAHVRLRSQKMKTLGSLDPAKRIMSYRRIVAAAILLITASPAVERASAASSNTVAMPLSSTHLHNVFRVTTNLFSGSAPESEAAFAEIARLGVKTVLSVDGSKPSVELAHK